MAKKLAKLVNVCTTTYMQSRPCTTGSPVIKSMNSLSTSSLELKVAEVNQLDMSPPPYSSSTHHTPIHALEHPPCGLSK